MSKYAPLRKYLTRQTLSEIVLTFGAVEDIIDAPLPKNAGTLQWWANIVEPDHGHVQREAWRAGVKLGQYRALHQFEHSALLQFARIDHKNDFKVRIAFRETDP